MRAVDLIAHKRRGGAHTEAEIRWLIGAYLRDEVPDYQIAAWLMAVCWQGLETDETRALTLALADSGRRIDFRAFGRPVVDKHSTGGVGDKTTLVLAPLLAAAGVAVAKMSGRGLGHTGGTIDKLEAIPGVTTAMDADAFVATVRAQGLAIAAQSPDLAPGDGRLYTLRDVTATVESVPLIASSVMSKKIATGAHAVVLDVKAGSGAFMKDLESARVLARAMVDLGRSVGLPTVAVISSMASPLGGAIGNALEIREAIETLGGRGPADLLELCLTLGAEVMVAAGASDSLAEAKQRLHQANVSGAALATFRDLIGSIGGDTRVIEEPDRLPSAPFTYELRAGRAGYVAEIDALACGEAAMRLGAGRASKGDAIDPAVGLVMRVKPGDRVRTGTTLVTIHSRDQLSVDSSGESEDRGQPGDDVVCLLRRAIWLSDAPAEPGPLILDIIR